MVLEQNSQMNLAHSSQDFDNYGTERSSRRSIWPSHGSRKGLLAAIGVGLVLMVLIISATVYVNKNSTGDKENETKERLVADSNLKTASSKSITLPDILGGVYGAKGFNGSWISGEEIQYLDSQGNVVLYNVATDVTTTIIHASVFIRLGRPFEVTLSPSREYALVGYDSQKLYRHSFFAKFAIYHFNTSTFDFLIPEPADQDPNQPDLLQLVQWSPKVDAIAFVYEYNVFYRSSAKSGTPSRKLTSTGSSEVYNGITDWVYEEEMFSTFRALWFSPEGTNLAFATFNDTEVKAIQFPLYGNPGQFPTYQYPIFEKIPYPKAGTTNPTASISIVKVSSLVDNGPVPVIEKLQFTEAIPLAYYIGTTTWATDSKLLVVTLNRHQNESVNVLCDANTIEACQQLWEVKQPNGWIDINTPVVAKSGSEVVFLSLGSKSEGNEHYRHIVQVDSNGKSVPITSGKFSVDSIVGWDEINNRVYFTAPGYNGTTADPSESHLYYVNLAGDKKTNCVTCDVQNLEKTSLCRSNGADLSKNFQYYVHSCNGPSVPEVVIRSLKDKDFGSVKNIWVDNIDLKFKLQLVQLPIVQDYNIPVANGFIAKARLLLPPNYKKNEKYPMLVDVYGGPGSQKVTQRFGIDWGTSLVTSKNIIYAYIDGRGSGRQSEDLMFQLYRNLGTVEIEDQIAAAKWLIAHNVDNVIDANRTAIWGWSYGGYSTAMVMGTDFEGIYKCGISVAPVTSWVFYDTIYTERYMGLPTLEDNIAGYNSSDVTNHVNNFRTKKYYLIHGNADDNVHYQQSMVLSRALERADILFRQQSYPDENHGLVSVRRHLYHSLEDFLSTECF